MNETPDTAQRPAQPVVATGPLLGRFLVRWMAACGGWSLGLVVRLVRRATSPNSIARRGFAGMIREARRNRDSAETELSRDYFQWRAELLRDKAEYYCKPNTKGSETPARGRSL